MKVAATATGPHTVVLTVEYRHANRDHVAVLEVDLKGCGNTAMAFSNAAARLHARLAEKGIGLPIPTRDRLAMAFYKAAQSIGYEVKAS